jgi:hypothetical protein
MNKLSKVVGVIMVLMLVIMLAACGNATFGTKPPIDKQPLDPPFGENADYHVGIVTNWVSTWWDEEYKSVMELIAEYGSADKGGIIKHMILPETFREEQLLVVSTITGLAKDPLMKALIVNQGDQGEQRISDAFQRIREAGRDDMLLIAIMPEDDPRVISRVADIIVSEDYVARGYYDIVRAKNMGATTFVFMSIPRHMDIEVLSRRRSIYEAACKDLGLEFVFETVPDRASEVWTADYQQQIYDMMPGLVEKYGKDTVFFTTSFALHEPVIKRVVELGALFVDSDYMTPFDGFPSVLELDLTDIAKPLLNWPAILKRIEEGVVAKGASGRLGCFPYSLDYCKTIGLTRLAIDIIEGRATGELQKDIKAAYESVTPGCNWMVQKLGDWIDEDLDNYYLLSMDTYIFGQGFSGVFSEPFPEKYYSIK